MEEKRASGWLLRDERITSDSEERRANSESSDDDIGCKGVRRNPEGWNTVYGGFARNGVLSRRLALTP